MAEKQSDIPARVSVLEHSVQELRSETRDGFVRVEKALTGLVNDVAKKAHPTNWLGLIAAAAATVAIISSIFGLAEWRIGQAQTMQERLMELRMQLTVERALKQAPAQRP